MAEPARTTPRRLRTRPTWLLAQANTRAHGLLAGALAASGTRGHHYRLLAALEEFGPASQIEVGRRVALDRSDVTLGLDELERRGLVRREPAPGDRRRKRVLLTPAGRRLLLGLDVVVQQVQDEFLEPLTRQERETLCTLLQRLGDPASGGSAPRPPVE